MWDCVLAPGSLVFSCAQGHRRRGTRFTGPTVASQQAAPSGGRTWSPGGMGTSLTLLLLSSYRAFCAHIHFVQ